MLVIIHKQQNIVRTNTTKILQTPNNNIKNSLHHIKMQIRRIIVLKVLKGSLHHLIASFYSFLFSPSNSSTPYVTLLQNIRSLYLLPPPLPPPPFLPFELFFVVAFSVNILQKNQLSKHFKFNIPHICNTILQYLINIRPV